MEPAWETLCPEILVYLFQKLTTKDLVVCGGVCSYWEDWSNAELGRRGAVALRPSGAWPSLLPPTVHLVDFCPSQIHRLLQQTPPQCVECVEAWWTGAECEEALSALCAHWSASRLALRGPVPASLLACLPPCLASVEARGLEEGRELLGALLVPGDRLYFPGGRPAATGLQAWGPYLRAHCPGLPSSAYLHLGKLKGVTRLVLEDCWGLDDAGLSTISQMTSLTWLHVSGADLVTCWSVLRPPSLRGLTLLSCSGLGPLALPLASLRLDFSHLHDTLPLAVRLACSSLQDSDECLDQDEEVSFRHGVTLHLPWCCLTPLLPFLVSTPGPLTLLLPAPPPPGLLALQALRSASALPFSYRLVPSVVIKHDFTAYDFLPA